MDQPTNTTHNTLQLPSSKRPTMYKKVSNVLRQNSETDDITFAQKRKKKVSKDAAAPIIRVEQTSIKITYYVAFIFLLYFICGIMYDTLSSERMSLFEVCIIVSHDDDDDDDVE